MSIRYLIAWFGRMGLAIANGTVREGAKVLLQAYRLHEGQLWLFILLGVWIGPLIFFRFLPATR